MLRNNLNQLLKHKGQLNTGDKVNCRCEEHACHFNKVTIKGDTGNMFHYPIIFRKGEGWVFKGGCPYNNV